MLNYMKLKKLLTSLIMIVLVITPILSADTVRSSDIAGSDIPESHVIENVTYVGQTGPYCGYASAATAIKYYEPNTTEHEVLYNSGIGYSSIYPKRYFEYHVGSSVGISYWPTDREFLANLYGLVFEFWQANNTLSENEKWDSYWIRIKENITNDVPVVTGVFAWLILSEEFNIKIPNKLWKFIPTTGGHALVVVGFNESNQSVCLNDPMTALFGNPEYGIYKWISIEKFKIAVNKVHPLTNFSYTIRIFKKSINDALSKDDMFKRARTRNIERMKGNISVYDEYVIANMKNKTELGINALKAFKKDLDSGLINQLKIVQSYKRLCSNFHLPLHYIANKIINIFCPNLIDKVISQWGMNFYYYNYIEKQNISQYLFNTYSELKDPELSELCKNEAVLFKHEAENWNQFAELFNIFVKRGILVRWLPGLLIIQKMIKVLENIITIEQKILDNSI